MPAAEQATVARLLEELRAGDPTAFDRLFEFVYERLHDLAHRQRRRWRGDETLGTTALLHEAYLRLAGQPARTWQDRSHFLAVVSTAMRQIFLDYAKRKRAVKRGGDGLAVSLEELESFLTDGNGVGEAGPAALIALDASLRRLERAEPRQARIVECRFFGGMTIEETAEVLGVSTPTVKRGWSMAQAWLYRDLTRSPDAPA